MTSRLEVFFDSDVIISSLISNKGAAYLLLNTTAVKPIVSDIQKEELVIVVKRLGLDIKRLNTLIEKKFRVAKIVVSKPEINKRFLKYVLDPNDAHVVAGIAASKPSFFVSYNLRHFKIDKIKADFKAISLTPAQLLQYIRLKRNRSLVS
ncbi:hypothetical protein HZB78_01400 [Candidatus Collierbacteria bacterium]|nr:hypothetical protein [Candidatus Collierbacteria bacterium]